MLGWKDHCALDSSWRYMSVATLVACKEWMRSGSGTYSPRDRLKMRCVLLLIRGRKVKSPPLRGRSRPLGDLPVLFSPDRRSDTIAPKGSADDGRGLACGE